ncbi:MAG: methylenetetrahydrofolate reductase [NAD(P)H] [Tissierellales bacterium]|jgi:methylenetetrahydrofolate reductase (NADPH)|nr:methylenetetrahydrofolate reductase [NAD(P)H] [Tissierellales bacterium]
MKIDKLFSRKNVVFSLEVFPPKPTTPIETIYDTLEELKDLKPDYISVTYGAGGNSSNNRTCELSSLIKNKYEIESLAHLTCIQSTKETIEKTLLELKKEGIENILAMRGDLPIREVSNGEYKHAFELIEHIRRKHEFSIAAACYPEGHLESQSLDQDIKYLKQKVDCGADYLISQLFFDNELFYNFKERAFEKGIQVPIQAGIMPVINKKQIERITKLCGATLPDKFLKIMNRYENDKIALRDAGIAYAVEQIIDLISSGVQGVHLYTMNNPYVARKINESVKNIIVSINSGQAI